MKGLLIALLLLVALPTHAATTITAQVTRNQTGSGSTFISSGFPFPPGLVTEQIITDGKIKITVDGSEVAANVSALRGRHNDGSLRAALIQFTVANMAEGDTLTASVQVDNGVRAYADPAYIKPTPTIVLNNNVILPTSSTYLVATKVVFQDLLITGAGTAEEELQYTTNAEDIFDRLIVKDYDQDGIAGEIGESDGAARYEKGRAMLTLWARTGDIQYYTRAITGAMAWLQYTTPGNTCTNEDLLNPDDRAPFNNSETTCAFPQENMSPFAFTYATTYLLTGYGDFWAHLAYLSQFAQRNISTQANAIDLTVDSSIYDAPRYNYSDRYGYLLAASMVEATMPISGQYFTAKQLNWENHLKWIVDGLLDSAWDIAWIPFDSGDTGTTVPAEGATLTQGGVTATLLGVYAEGMHDPKTFTGEAMPVSGHLQVTGITGGSFTSGVISGISATSTGAEVSDYRVGLIGSRSNSDRVHVVSDKYLPVFQQIFPLNFLIDYYLNVDADSRIPAVVKTNLDIILTNVELLEPGDSNYGWTHETWGDTLYGHPYNLENPVEDAVREPWSLPEYVRMIAFVLKTSGEDTVNGASYATWYSRCVSAANFISIPEWKNFGQFYGFGADTPWMMAQSSFTAPVYREPTYYATIPSDAPDLARGDVPAPGPTCSDGIQNGTETGVDCGGDTCDPCESTPPDPTMSNCHFGVGNGSIGTGSMTISTQ